MEYEVVKLYYVDQYTGWQTKVPYSFQSMVEGYFIKVEGLYFKLGEKGDGVYVDESE